MLSRSKVTDQLARCAVAEALQVEGTEIEPGAEEAALLQVPRLT
jgi:hypothetical protein